MRISVEIRGSSRLDLLLLEALERSSVTPSRTRLKEWFREGRIRIVGGKSPLAPSEKLKPGSYEIEIDADLADASAHPSPQGSFLEVVHEDQDLLVLNKASGIPSVPHRSDETETAVGSALARFPGLAAVGDPERPLEPGLLHRLDTGTSGLICFAKSNEEFHRLRDLWKSGGVIKTYRAICSARKSKSSHPRVPSTLRPTLGHDARSAKRMIVMEMRPAQARGKPLPTITHLDALQDLSDGRIDLTVRIETGVMHQIRCTLAWLGWPIEGDPIYHGKAAERLWLHAWKLVVPRADGTKLALEALLPPDWPKPA